jgi:hypothetical protein
VVVQVAVQVELSLVVGTDSAAQELQVKVIEAVTQQVLVKVQAVVVQVLLEQIH